MERIKIKVRSYEEEARRRKEHFAKMVGLGREEKCTYCGAVMDDGFCDSCDEYDDLNQEGLC